MDKWKCTLCGYIYDPKEVSKEQKNIAIGPFESLPEDWVCPMCSASKESFKKMD